MANLLDSVVYFCHLGDVEYANGGKRYCVAAPCGLGPNGTRTIFAFQKVVQCVLPDIEHAETLAEALEGFKWATIEEATSWGIDLNDPDQDITLI